jgi:hypothetical protein
MVSIVSLDDVITLIKLKIIEVSSPPFMLLLLVKFKNRRGLSNNRGFFTTNGGGRPNCAILFGVSNMKMYPFMFESMVLSNVCSVLVIVLVSRYALVLLVVSLLCVFVLIALTVVATLELVLV